ncbi:MAG: 30S ribosome-binding factor RbfA [Patescibacteria group bacterium]
MKNRVPRLEELILRELGQIIQREFEHSSKDFVSITRVHLGKDLTRATIFVSVFPEQDQEEIIKNLNQSSGFLGSFLSKRMRAYNLPKLYFKYDPSVSNEAKVYDLIEKNKEKK